VLSVERDVAIANSHINFTEFNGKKITIVHLFLPQVDIKHGKDVEEYVNGQSYQGNFDHGLRHGFGVYYYKDCTKMYEGEYKNGKYDSHGVYYYESGTKMYEGEWKDGKYDGHGVYYYRSGIKMYDGEWKDGKRDGKGDKYYKNGTK
jgi:antitoxin component YwqK of YwqJK toxin-antitoxin module